MNDSDLTTYENQDFWNGSPVYKMVFSEDCAITHIELTSDPIFPFVIKQEENTQENEQTDIS